MNKNLHIAFLATAMAATSTLAVAKPPAPAPAPAPQFIGTDVGSFSFSGAGDQEFYVNLDPGQYVVTGDIKTTADSAKNFNMTGVTLSGPSFSDAFEHQGSDHYFENAYSFTIATATRLLVSVGTNDKSGGGYDGTLTVAGSELASDVPEPATAALLLAGLGALAISARRRRA